MSHPERDTTQIRRALRYAEEKHRGEVRKGTEDSPYILHPTAAAILAAMLGSPIHVIVAVILHDTVEDTAATIEEVRELFGDKVADIVSELTKPKGEKLSASQTADRLSGLDSVVAKAADLLINLGDVVDDFEAHGGRHLSQLFKDPVAKIDSYLELLTILTRRTLWRPQSGHGPGYVDAVGRRLGDLEPRARAMRDRLVLESS